MTRSEQRLAIERWRRHGVVGAAGDVSVASTLQRRALMVVVANGAFYGGGMMICPDASRDDGLLDICVVGEVSRREVLRLLSAVFSGKHVGDPHVEFFRTRTVRIESAQPCELHLDGELAGTLPAEFRAVPSALRVLVGSGSAA